MTTELRKTNVTLNKVLSILLILLCTVSGRLKAKATTQIVVDARGRSVQIHCPIRRLVSLNEDSLEVIRILHAQNLVVGVDNRIPGRPFFWPVLKNRQTVGKWNEPSYERIAILHPDLVLSYGNRPGLELEKKLGPLGIQVLRLDFYKMLSMPREIKTLGMLLNREREAEIFLKWYHRKLDLIQDLIKKDPHQPRIYLESYSNYHALGPGSGGYEMGVLAGGQNIASHLSIPYPEVTPEWVLTRNPDVIIKTVSSMAAYRSGNPETLRKIRDRIIHRPGWRNIRAVKIGRVYVMESDICAGPSAIIGIAYMAKWFHPRQCSDLNPEEIHRQYLEQFQGVAYRGIYVYPNEH